jgi:hypothetical protein
MTSPAPEIFWRESSDFCINYIDFLRYSSVNPNDILRQDREKSPTQEGHYEINILYSGWLHVIVIRYFTGGCRC